MKHKAIGISVILAFCLLVIILFAIYQEYYLPYKYCKSIGYDFDNNKVLDGVLYAKCCEEHINENQQLEKNCKYYPEENWKK